MRGYPDYAELAKTIAAVPGVTARRAGDPGAGDGDGGRRDAGREVYGMAAEDLANVPRIGGSAELSVIWPITTDGIAIGSGIARELGVTVGDRIRLISPQGVQDRAGGQPARQRL